MVPPPFFRPAAFACVPNGRVIDTRNDDSPAFLFLFASGSAQRQNFFAGLREVQFFGIRDQWLSKE